MCMGQCVLLFELKPAVESGYFEDKIFKHQKFFTHADRQNVSALFNTFLKRYSNENPHIVLAETKGSNF